jgi:TolB-like protein/Tfp pilus assembly protein PilF
LQALLSGLDRMAEQPTVGVRPFEAIGEGARQAVLAAGLTSDLTTDLASVPGLTVLGGSRPVREAAPGSVALTERYVVTGSVQLAGERLRVNVQLADARAGRQLWTERIERDTADLFAVQDDILRRLLAVLPVKIDQAERERSASRYTRSPEAYELFHAGLRAMGAREQAQNESARELYWRAIALDPGFARAYAGVAMTHAQDFRQMWASEGGAALAKALETAEAAHRIDPANAEALWVLAFARAHERRHDEAARLIEEALKRNPSFADSYFLKGLLLMETGNPREALTWMHAAMRLVPNPGYIHYFGFGQAYFFLKDHTRARTNLQAALARNPAHAESHLYLAATEAEQGHMDRASWHVEEVRSLRPRFAGREWLERHPVVDREQRKRLEEVLARLGLRD